MPWATSTCRSPPPRRRSSPRATAAARRSAGPAGARAPVFRTSGIAQTQQFLRWIEEHDAEIRAVTEETSQHLKLLEIRPFAFGTTVFLRFRFDAGDAMGMNMATIACDRGVRIIEPAPGA